MCFGRNTKGAPYTLAPRRPRHPPKHADPPSWATHSLRQGHAVALGVAQDERAALTEVGACERDGLGAEPGLHRSQVWHGDGQDPVDGRRVSDGKLQQVQHLGADREPGAAVGELGVGAT